MRQAGYIVLAFVIVALNAFFVATEFAIVRVRATRIEEMVQNGVRRAAAARHVLRRLDTYISACQLGVTISSLALGWLGEAAFASFLKPAFAGEGAWQSTAAHSVAIGLAFLLMIGTGSPPVDAMNALQFVVGLGFGTDGGK